MHVLLCLVWAVARGLGCWILYVYVRAIAHCSLLMAGMRWAGMDGLAGMDGDSSCGVRVALAQLFCTLGFAHYLAAYFELLCYMHFQDSFWELPHNHPRAVTNSTAIAIPITMMTAMTMSDILHHISSNAMFGNIVLAFVAYLSFCAVYQIVYYRFFHPLSKFPGPFWASVTRLWIAYHNIKEDEPYVEHELHKKYGPIIRISPTLLLVSSATALPTIYHRHADKSKHYISGSFGETESVFNMQSWKTHAQFKKLIAGPYSFSNIKKMESLIDMRVDAWTEKLDEFAKTNEKFDFSLWAVFMAYDIISEVGFGAPFGFVETGTDIEGLIKGFHDGLPAFGLMCRLHPFTSWIKSTFLNKYLVASPEQQSGIGTLMRFRDKLLDQRIKDIENGTTGGRIDLLQAMLDARDDNGKPLDIDYVKAEVLLVLLAGADTTGTSFQTMIHYITSDEAVYAKLMVELDSTTRSGKLSAFPQFHEVLAHCPYYIACVKESMRLCPSAPNIFPRMSPEGGYEINGQAIPGNVEVTCNPWQVHRDAAVYGEDAMEFRPERWMDAERARVFDKYNMVFGYGPRSCLGKDIALMELYKAPLQFFRKYRLELQSSQPGGKKEEFVIKGGVGYWKDMWMQISKRAPV